MTSLSRKSLAKVRFSYKAYFSVLLKFNGMNALGIDTERISEYSLQSLKGFLLLNRRSDSKSWVFNTTCRLFLV